MKLRTQKNYLKDHLLGISGHPDQYFKVLSLIIFAAQMRADVTTTLKNKKERNFKSSNVQKYRSKAWFCVHYNLSRAGDYVALNLVRELGFIKLSIHHNYDQ